MSHNVVRDLRWRGGTRIKYENGNEIFVSRWPYRRMFRAWENSLIRSAFQGKTEDFGEER